MNATAIVYVSETGFTARYATMLSGKLELPVYTLADALKTLPAGTKIVYMGWLMAGSVKDYRKAARRFQVEAVIGVGLGDTGAQDAGARKACRLPADAPVFTIQGGMDHAKLHGGYKVGINILTKVMAAKKNRTPDEDKMLTLLLNGGDYVHERELAAVLAWAGK